MPTLRQARAASARTASGSRAVTGQRARVASGSRIFVEGKHDAELVEKVWGDDLRVEGVVVEMLDGVDDLAGAIREFAPGPGRRMGVLVDHLVPGTKEWRVVEEARAVKPYAAHVLVVGHPYVDVWQSVKPQRLGHGRVAGHPPRHVVEGRASRRTSAGRTRPRPTSPWPGAGSWRRCGTYADLEPELLGRVEELIDFVTAPD